MMQTSLSQIGPLFLRWRRTAILAVSAAVGLALAAGNQFGPLDQQLRMARDGLRSHAASGEIHIVEIDARSLKAIDKWPWPRGIHAELIDRLSQAKPRSIAFDVDFSAMSQPAEDAKLARALDDAGRSVILATLRQNEGGGRSGYVDNIPAKIFADKAFLAAVNVLPDDDGYVREVPLGIITMGVPRPSLPAMVAERNAEIDRYFPVDYAIDPDSIPRHSVIDILRGEVPAEALAGKRLMIGATAAEIWDRYAVPGHGVIPGVVIQALAAETLMQGPIPTTIPGWPLLVVALASIAGVIRLKSRPLRVGAFTVAITGLLALPVATESLFALSLTIAPALCALLAAAALSAISYAAEQYLQRALTDPATGLANLAALEFAPAARGRGNVIVARIDRFAALASGLGPESSAALVLRVAERLKFGHIGREIYRTDDSTLVWLEGVADEDSLEDRFDAIATVMRTPVECGRLVDVSLNFGVASGHGIGAKQLVANAGLAALHAAQRGARWQRFLDDDSDEINWHLSLLGELDAAMSSGQLWNAYQPKLDLKTGEIVGVEALVRWLHPQRGPIGPDSFIPVVEENGRARDLTAHVLEQALEDAQHWDRHGFPIGVAVNVSATLLADHGFIELVGQILQSHALPTSRVTIEVTESAAMSSPERAIAALESWRSLGVGISIDDYGTGQSSLNYLQKMPATELKIDKSFVQTIVTDSRNAIMVRSTVALAHELGMKVVAEGIEDRACLDMLGEMGCDTAQGYHIARPMSADAMMDFLGDRQRQAA